MPPHPVTFTVLAQTATPSTPPSAGVGGPTGLRSGAGIVIAIVLAVAFLWFRAKLLRRSGG